MNKNTERLVLTGLGIVVGALIGSQKGDTKEKRQKNAQRYGFFGGLSGLALAEIFGCPNNTVNYSLRWRGKVVYHGITFRHRIPQRAQEHQRSGKVFDEIIVGSPVSRTTALKKEKRWIKRDAPKYNIQHNR